MLYLLFSLHTLVTTITVELVFPPKGPVMAIYKLLAKFFIDRYTHVELSWGSVAAASEQRKKSLPTHLRLSCWSTTSGLLGA